jgi:hypothetical protein
MMKASLGVSLFATYPAIQVPKSSSNKTTIVYSLFPITIFVFGSSISKNFNELFNFWGDKIPP